MSDQMQRVDVVVSGGMNSLLELADIVIGRSMNSLMDSAFISVSLDVRVPIERSVWELVGLSVELSMYGYLSDSFDGFRGLWDE